MKIIFAVLATILVAYAAIHWNERKSAKPNEALPPSSAQPNEALSLSRKTHAADKQAIAEMNANLKTIGWARSRQQIPVARDIRVRAVAYLKEVGTNPSALAEEPSEARRFITLTDQVIDDLTRIAGGPTPAPQDTTFRLNYGPATPKPWRPSGTSLDKPTR